eukprot:357881-Chlamydomonas_euryale.AAC.29
MTTTTPGKSSHPSSAAFPSASRLRGLFLGHGWRSRPPRCMAIPSVRAQVATTALESNVREAHTVFVTCMGEAARLADERACALADAEALLASGGGGGGAGAGRRQRWDHMLRLANLGLTASDVARLTALRRAAAARTIQRAARPWLAAIGRRRRLHEAEHRASLLRTELTHAAALTIQRCWRGCVGRRTASAAHAAAVAEARVEAVRRAA